jgi:hypothetical protein
MDESENEDMLRRRAVLEQDLRALAAELQGVQREPTRQALLREHERLYAELDALIEALSPTIVPAARVPTVIMSGGTVQGSVVAVNAGTIIHTIAPVPDLEAKARDFMIDILGSTYRRAFALNFTSRFIAYPNYKRVRKSIKGCRVFVQKKLVRAGTMFDQGTMVILRTMLRQLEVMETVFEKMEPYARDPDGTFDPRDASETRLAGRMDGSGQPGLTQLFIDVELIRLDFLLNTTRLAALFNIPLPYLPDTPIQLDHGSLLRPNADLPTTAELAEQREKLVSGRRFGIAPNTYDLGVE